MSIPTLAATRAYMSELKNESGTEQHLSFDKFPFSGLSKVSNDKLIILFYYAKLINNNDALRRPRVTFYYLYKIIAALIH